MVRLQKYMADCGVASRRASEQLIEDGKVTVNGRPAAIGQSVDETKDIVAVNGKVIKPQKRHVVIMLYKPRGVVSTSEDERGRKTVQDFVKDLPYRLYNVGRLDLNSEGLLLLTNDGDLAARLTQPSHEVDKTYLARISMHLTPDEIHQLRAGVTLEDGFRTSPAKVRVIREETFASAVLITIHEGHNRQVRRMMEAVGHKVLLLRRVKFGPIDLKGVERGAWRDLTAEEIKALKEL